MEIVTKFAPIALALIMFGLGLGLRTEDFLRVFHNPKIFIVGLTTQIIILPIVAYLLIILLNVSSELALGLMIIAAAPGGVTSNVLTKIAKGDVALSISLTALTSLISIISVPIIVFHSANLIGVTEATNNLSMISISLQMAGIVTLPVIIGMLTREYRPNSSKSMENIVNAAATILFVIIVLAAIASEWDTLMENIGKLGPAVVALEVLMLTIGFQSAKILDLESVRATTVSIESGIQNATVGITVGGLVLTSPDGGLSTLSLPSGVYGALMYLVIAPFMYWRMTTQES